MLNVEDVHKTYRGGVRANDGVTLSVGAGEVFGLLGHNGAGKTTLVNQVIGLARPDSGAIRIGEVDAVAHPDRARELCSVQAQAHVPLVGLSPRQAIELVGRLRGGRAPDVRRRAEELAAALDLDAWLDVSGDGGGDRLSGGVRRLAAFCMAAVTPGRVVVLDEPTNDVDPLRRRLLWDQVRALADRGCAVLLVTHNVAEAERAVDRLAVLDHGRVVAEGTPAALKARLDAPLRLEVVEEPGVEPAPPPPDLRELSRAGRRRVLAVPPQAAAAAVGWADGLRGAGAIEEFALGPATLEDVYAGLLDEDVEVRDAVAG